MSRSEKPSRKPDVHELLGRLANAEEQFLKQEFLAPVLRGGRIRVRIAGVVCQVKVRPASFQGWGVFQPLSHSEAQFVRTASMQERRRYLELFPLVRLVVCRQSAQQCLGSAASFGDSRFQIDGLVPVELPDAVQTFDVICCRFDGARFWYDEIDARHSPAAAAYLRSALAQSQPPEELNRLGLTAEERAAYELNYWEQTRAAGHEVVEPAPGVNPRHRRRSKRGKNADAAQPSADAVRQRLRESLSHAGAQLIDYLERADSFRVTYRFGGRSYTSAVNKTDLTLQVAGICLSGEDQKFDLASLVGVLHEAQTGGRTVPVGDEHGIPEDQYWHVHPPRNP